MRRSRSRSPQKETPPPARRMGGFSDRPSAGFSDRPKPGGGFSDKAPTEPQQKMTTAEILDYYKQYNPNQNLTNHNKAER